MKLEKEAVMQALEKAVRGTFENTLFLDFEKAVEINTPGFKMKDQLTYIKIRSPYFGKLYLVINYDLAFDLIKALYNEIDYNAMMLLVDEIMAEICNTVTGRFLADIVPSNIEFEFSLPVCTKIAKEIDIQNFDTDTFALKFIHQDNAVYCIYKN